MNKSNLPALAKNAKDVKQIANVKQDNKEKQRTEDGAETKTKDKKRGKNKRKDLKKKKPKLLKKEWVETNEELGCDEVEEDVWVRYSNSSPSNLCKPQDEDTQPICVCSRRRPGAKIKLLCGKCLTAFKHQIVNGKLIGEKSNKTAANRTRDENQKRKEKEISKEVNTKENTLVNAKLTSEPKTKNQTNTTKSSKKAKLEWVLTETNSKCVEDDKVVYSSKSPSTLCQEVTNKMVCLCVKKGNSMKHVCGKCKLTYKPKRIKQNKAKIA